MIIFFKVLYSYMKLCIKLDAVANLGQITVHAQA